MFLKIFFCLAFFHANLSLAQDYDLRIEGSDTLRILPEGTNYMEYQSSNNLVPDKLPDGKWIMYDDNFNEEWSKIIYFSIQENCLTDTVEIYSIDGVMLEVGQYKKGKRFGIWEKFYKSSRLHFRINYDYDEVLESIKYFENGNKERRIIKIFDDTNIEKNLWTYWYLNGCLKEQGIMLDNNDDEKMKIGEWKQWYGNGELQSSKYYEEGALHGKCIFIYENGEDRKIEYYKKGKTKKQVLINHEVRENKKYYIETETNSKGKVKRRVEFLIEEL